MHSKEKGKTSKDLILVLVIAITVLLICGLIHFSNQYYDSHGQDESSYSQSSVEESDTTTTTKPEAFTHTYTATTKRATTYSYDPTPVSQRCWYCSKVIFSDGRPIHATHKYLDTYECDYCGKSNVKE